MLDVVRRNRAAGIPTDVLHLDPQWFHDDWRCEFEFAPDRFPDAARDPASALGAPHPAWLRAASTPWWRRRRR
jgi:alpha-glucosidase (family GH31 glycosyl hydrolase)